MTQKKTPRINPKTTGVVAPKTTKEAKEQISRMLKKNAEAMRALA